MNSLILAIIAARLGERITDIRIMDHEAIESTIETIESWVVEERLVSVTVEYRPLVLERLYRNQPRGYGFGFDYRYLNDEYYQDVYLTARARTTNQGGFHELHRVRREEDAKGRPLEKWVAGDTVVTRICLRDSGLVANRAATEAEIEAEKKVLSKGLDEYRYLVEDLEVL